MKVIGLAGNLAVIGVMVMDRRTRFTYCREEKKWKTLVTLSHIMRLEVKATLDPKYLQEERWRMENQHVPPLPLLLGSPPCDGQFSEMTFHLFKFIYLIGCCDGLCWLSDVSRLIYIWFTNWCLMLLLLLMMMMLIMTMMLMTNWRFPTSSILADRDSNTTPAILFCSGADSLKSLFFVPRLIASSWKIL